MGQFEVMALREVKGMLYAIGMTEEGEIILQEIGQGACEVGEVLLDADPGQQHLLY